MIKEVGAGVGGQESERQLLLLHWGYNLTRGGVTLVKPCFSALVSTFENRGQQRVHEVVKKNKSDDA